MRSDIFSGEDRRLQKSGYCMRHSSITPILCEQMTSVLFGCGSGKRYKLRSETSGVTYLHKCPEGAGIGMLVKTISYKVVDIGVFLNNYSE